LINSICPNLWTPTAGLLQGLTVVQQYVYQNIQAKNNQNLTIGFKVTVENVGGPGFFETQCSVTSVCVVMLIGFFRDET